MSILFITLTFSCCIGLLLVTMIHKAKHKIYYMKYHAKCPVPVMDTLSFYIQVPTRNSRLNKLEVCTAPQSQQVKFSF